MDTRRTHTEDFLAAAHLAAALADEPEVARRWTQESACAGMTVGGLAHHLLQQLTHTVDLLAADPPQAEPIGLLDHYARAAWVRGDVEVNRSIAQRADGMAAAGPSSLATAGRLDRLAELLAAPRSPDVVLVTWQGWALTTDDYLTTRLMELVVHSDDLAVSIDVPTPEFPDAVLQPVLGLLTSLAARRHGQTAIVRALSRAERARGSIAAF